MPRELDPHAIDNAVQRLNHDMGVIMKERLVAKMEEIIKPILDDILEETAEEIMRSIKANVTSGFDMMTYGHIFKLIINGKEKVI